MKQLSLVLAFCFSASALAETTIFVQCDCTYYADFIGASYLAAGVRKNPSQDEITGCTIVDGKVISGCWAAKMNAQHNCEEYVMMVTGTDILSRPHAMIDESRCYGEISTK